MQIRTQSFDDGKHPQLRSILLTKKERTDTFTIFHSIFSLIDPQITVVTLGVSDIDESISFYRDGLDFPIRDREDDSDIAFFTLNGTWLAVYPRELLAEDATVPADGDGFSGVTLAHNVSTKGEVETILAQAEAAGGRIVKPAQDVFWGGYSGYFEDPDGHLWEIAYPLLSEE